MITYKYWFLHDNNTGWFSKIIAEPNEPGETKEYDISLQIRGSFLTNILAREPNNVNKKHKGDTYIAWSISAYEYERLQKITELFPKHQEYMELVKNYAHAKF